MEHGKSVFHILSTTEPISDKPRKLVQDILRSSYTTWFPNETPEIPVGNIKEIA